MNLKTATGSALAGAALMYLFDPERGRRRRALGRDRIVHWTRRGLQQLDIGKRDIGNRLDGMQARVRHWLDSPARAPEGEILAARLRAQLGRLVSHPHAIQIQVEGHTVRLSGPVLTREHPGLLAGLRLQPGVHTLHDQLNLHDKPDGIPSLQGGVERQMPRLAGRRWSPAMGSAAVLGGGALGVAGWRQGGAAGAALATLGLLLLVKGAGGQGRAAPANGAIELAETVDIDASPEAVFEAWSDWQQLAQWLTPVKAIQPLDGDAVRWTVQGPVGERLSWETRLQRKDRPRELAWTTVDGAPVIHSGRVLLEAAGQGTRCHIALSFHPTMATSGHRLTGLLGLRPRAQLREDLQRMKSALERGLAPNKTGPDMASLAPGV